MCDKFTHVHVCMYMYGFGRAGKYGISSTTLTVDASDRNGTTTPPTCWEFQIKHIWTLRVLALGSTLSEFSDKRRSKLYKTWAGRLANVSNSWDSTWIECRGPAKACEPNPRPFHPAIRNQILLSEVWWNRTSPLSGSGSEDSRGTHPVLMYVDARPRPYLVEA